MLESIKKITINDLPNLIEYLNKNISNISLIENELGGFDLDNGYGTFFYTPKNIFFKKISLFKENDKIKAFNFIGSFDLSFEDLLGEYGDYREEYSYRDDLFFYFFNESKNNFSIEVFLEKKIDLENQKEKLKQFSIRFK